MSLLDVTSPRSPGAPFLLAAFPGPIHKSACGFLPSYSQHVSRDIMPTSVSRAVAPQVQDPIESGKIWAFNALQVLGFVLNIIVFSTAILSPRVKRTLLWYIFMGSWILWTVAHSLLFIVGRQFGDRPPPQTLCLIQAGLVYAFPSYMELLNLGLLIHIYLVFRAVAGDRPPPSRTPLIFIFFPISVFLAMFIGLLVFGARNPEKLARTQTPMYCHMVDGTFFTISAALCALPIFAVIGLEVDSGITLYRNWEMFKATRHTWGNGTMAFRILVFSIGPTLALIVSVTAQIMPEDLYFVSIICVHSLPSLAAIVFGAHKDIYQFWYCCGDRRKNYGYQHPSYRLSSPPTARKEGAFKGNGQNEALLEDA